MTKASTSFAALAKRFWLALMLVVCTVSAAKAADIETFELNTPYEVKGVFVSKKMAFTAEKDMLLKVCFVGSGSFSFYSSDSFAYTDAIADVEHAYETNEIGGVEYGRRYQLSVTKGNTYYIKAECSSSSVALQFIGIENSDVFELKGISFGGNEAVEGGAISASKQLEVAFSKSPKTDDDAVFTWGSFSKKIEVHTSSTSLVVKTQSVVDSIMNLAENPAKEGDKVSVSFTNVKDSKDNLYNGDGNLTLNFTIPAAPATISNADEVDAWMAAGFRSYWVKGDKGGILTVEYSRDLMTYDNGQTAQISLLFGYQGGTDDNVQYSFGKVKGAYDRITIDGNKLIVDFTDILYKPKYTYINLSLYNVLMADGTQPSYNSKTYITYHPTYKDMTTDLSYEFTPVDGSTLTGNEIELYFSDKDAITFTSFEISYQTQSDEKKTESVTEFTSKEDEAEGSNGISYFFKVSDNVVAGKNVRVSLGGVVAIDGKDHPVSAKFNPGDELLSDISIVKTTPKTDLTYEAPKSIAISFSEAVSAADASKIVLSDETTGKACQFTVANAGESTLAFTYAFEDGHEYTLSIPSQAVGNEQFVSTNGKYGNYYTGGEFNYTFCSSCKGYDFLTNPLAGSTVDKLETIEFLPKSTASSDAVSYNSGFSYDDEQYADPVIYAILKSEYDAAESTTWTNGTDVFTTKADADVVKAAKEAHPATAKDKDGNGQGFTLTFDDPIVKAGEYYIVFQYGTFNYGDGLDSGFNDSEVTVPFTVSGNSKAQGKDFTFSVTPDEDTDVESLSEISIKFSEPIYFADGENTQTVSVFNRDFPMEKYPATLTYDADTYTASVVLDNEWVIEEEGVYELDFSEAAFGDKDWADGNHSAGFYNNYFALYFGVTPSSEPSDYTLTADPADGSTVESLGQIAITVNGLEYPALDGGEATVSVLKDGVEIGTATLQLNPDDYFDPILYINFGAKSPVYTEAGVYTFVIASGTIQDDFYEAINQEFTLTYTVTGASTAIHNATLDATNGDIYDLAGRKIAQPARGLYISGGKLHLQK